MIRDSDKRTTRIMVVSLRMSDTSGGLAAKASETVSKSMDSLGSWHDPYVRAVMNRRTSVTPALMDRGKAAVGAGFIPARSSRIADTGGDKPQCC